MGRGRQGDGDGDEESEKQMRKKRATQNGRQRRLEGASKQRHGRVDGPGVSTKATPCKSNRAHGNEILSWLFVVGLPFSLPRSSAAGGPPTPRHNLSVREQ